VPENPHGFTSLMALSRTLNKNNAPVVVHCSAGIGRTGSFITVSNVLDEIRVEMSKEPKPETAPKISVARTVQKIRQERMGLIQTDVRK
jgi:protein tyrosine phosphatase